MAYQAAYFSLYGRLESQYEPAMVKGFLHGRTEAIRAVTPESSEFVHLFFSDASPRQKMDALRKACKQHTELTKACLKGLGQDRIMYAMYCLAQRKDAGEASSDGSGSESEDGAGGGSTKPPLPAIFRDPGWADLGHSTLSTSNCGNPSLRLFGFGAVVPDGYGIGYIIKSDSIAFVASSKHRQTQRFLDALEAFFLEARRMLKQLHQDANRKPNATFVDHHVGEVDARTGLPLSHVRANGSVEEATSPVEGRDNGYNFYGTEDDIQKLLEGQRVGPGQRARVVPTGTRIETVELS